MSRGNILLIDDDDKLRNLLKRVIGLEGFTVFDAENLKAGLLKLQREPVQVILCDVRLPDGNGMEFIGKMRAAFPGVEIIMFTGDGNIGDGVKSIQRGAFEYLTKGSDNDRIIPLLDRAIEKIRLQSGVSQQEEKRKSLFDFSNILGNSEWIKSAIAMAEKVAPTDATVMLLGETGTGKEVFAQAIHTGSKRCGKPFVALNVSSFSRELLESELFGHVAGAFTSAVKDKRGLMEEADGGTLFLDEIGEMAFDLQAKLLRVLETGEFIKVGDTKSTRVFVRVITATNRDLETEVQTGRFREDLFYRLNMFTLSLPSLGLRKEDIPLLADHFLHVYTAKTKKMVTGMSPDFTQSLMGHEWKGNIRELKNIIERAVILANEPELALKDLPLDFKTSREKGKSLSAFELSSVEKLHIQRVLNHTKGNKLAAAKLLNIGLTTLYRKIEEYDLAEKN